MQVSPDGKHLPQPQDLWLCCRYESLGSEGYHSLYRWYQAFETTHFPDPMGLREMVAKWSLGIYPNCLKFAMAIFDVPESIAVTRKRLCEAGGVASITRVQASHRATLSLS